MAAADTLAVTVILPAHNEADYLPACLAALWASDMAGVAPRLIVVANGCTDDTAAIARAAAQQAEAAGWALEVIETETGGKLHALGLGDAACGTGVRVYLDADVIVSPGLIGALARRLAQSEAPLYASGTPQILPAKNAFSRAYGRFWQRLPFVAEGVPGFGLFAMNAAGRARWGDWPDIIADDAFARAHFAPDERVLIALPYGWPLVEGFGALVRVRRRQNAGVRELEALFAQLMQAEGSGRSGCFGILRRALRDPLGFAAYAGVQLAVRTPLYADSARWARGR